MVDFDALVLRHTARVFGQPVLYAPAPASGALPFAATGVFDRAYLEVSMSDMGAPVATRGPVLGVRESDFPPGVSPAQGDRVTVAGTVFQVTNPEPDGHGHVLLRLKVARP